MTEIEQLLTRVAAKARPARPWGWTSLPEPVDAATLTRAVPLPPLLTALYLQIADGGFGPETAWCPCWTAGPPASPPLSRSTSPTASAAARTPTGPGPTASCRYSTGGCAMYACVDCHSPQATVLLFEPNPGDPDHAWFVDAPGLTEWLRTWTDGKGWYEEMNEELDMPAWTDHRTSTASAQAC